MDVSVNGDPVVAFPGFNNRIRYGITAIIVIGQTVERHGPVIFQTDRFRSAGVHAVCHQLQGDLLFFVEGSIPGGKIPCLGHRQGGFRCQRRIGDGESVAIQLDCGAGDSFYHGMENQSVFIICFCFRIAVLIESTQIIGSRARLIGQVNTATALRCCQILISGTGRYIEITGIAGGIEIQDLT